MIAAYLAALHEAGGGANARTVRDLAASLALKLDRGIVSVQDRLKPAFTAATADNLEEVTAEAPTAHEDARGTRWSLGAWAGVNCQTLGRSASSRGVIDAAPAKVAIEGTGCLYCSDFWGEYAFDEVPGWPPLHAACECTAAAV